MNWVLIHDSNICLKIIKLERVRVLVNITSESASKDNFLLWNIIKDNDMNYVEYWPWVVKRNNVK